jgi:hypothetical protein
MTTQVANSERAVGRERARDSIDAGLDVIAREKDSFIRAYEAEGFALVKGIFSLDEVIALREICFDTFRASEGKIADLASYPALRGVVLDDRVLAVARAALGHDLVYFGDSTFYANSRFDRHIHHDARGDVDDPSSTEFPILRMGIYLQDHAFHSNGLKVRPGSHRRVFWNVRNGLRLFGVGGKRLNPRAFRPSWFYNVPTEPGDIVFWNLRTHHSAHAIRLRGTELALPPRIEEILPARFVRPMTKDRCALFMSWGRESPQLDAYIKQLGFDSSAREQWLRSSFDSREARDAFEQKAVAVRPDVLRLARISG